MKIGITGGTGFIGQHLLRLYCPVHTFVCITSGRLTKSRFEHVNLSYVPSDYSEASMREAFSGCDCLIHMGGKRSTKENELHPDSYDDSIRSSLTLFSVAHQLGISNVVFCSSCAVYDKDTPSPHREDMAISPLSYYGVSKAVIELYAQQYNKRFGMHIKALRIAQVLGNGERGGYMLSVFKERCEQGLPLDVFGTGQSGREYIYVKDVARAILCACQRPERSGVFNIGSGLVRTNAEVARLFCEVYENAAGFRFHPEQRENPLSHCMDVSRAQQELGFTIQYSMQDALTDMRQAQ